MTKTIKREDIIKALETEPLAFGLFFHAGGENSPNTIIGGTCEVSAVGAVLRHTLGNKLSKMTYWQGTNLAKIATKGHYASGNHRRVRMLLEDRNYLGALCVKFESQNLGYLETGKARPKHRRALVKFVIMNFPEKIKVRL